MLPKGGYGANGSAPFNLFRKAAEVFAQTKEQPRPVVKKAKAEPEPLLQEKVAPGVSVAVPGITKSGQILETDAERLYNFDVFDVWKVEDDRLVLASDDSDDTLVSNGVREWNAVVASKFGTEFFPMLYDLVALRGPVTREDAVEYFQNIGEFDWANYLLSEITDDQWPDILGSLSDVAPDEFLNTASMKTAAPTECFRKGYEYGSSPDARELTAREIEEYYPEVDVDEFYQGMIDGLQGDTYRLDLQSGQADLFEKDKFAETAPSGARKLEEGFVSEIGDKVVVEGDSGEMYYVVPSTGTESFHAGDRVVVTYLETRSGGQYGLEKVGYQGVGQWNTLPEPDMNEPKPTAEAPKMDAPKNAPPQQSAPPQKKDETSDKKQDKDSDKSKDKKEDKPKGDNPFASDKKDDKEPDKKDDKEPDKKEDKTAANVEDEHDGFYRLGYEYGSSPGAVEMNVQEIFEYLSWDVANQVLNPGGMFHAKNFFNVTVNTNAFQEGMRDALQGDSSKIDKMTGQTDMFREGKKANVVEDARLGEAGNRLLSAFRDGTDMQPTDRNPSGFEGFPPNIEKQEIYDVLIWSPQEIDADIEKGVGLGYWDDNGRTLHYKGGARKIAQDEFEGESEEQESDQPQPEDIVMFPSGSLGGKTSVSEVEGHFLGEFDTEDEAEAFIKQYMQQQNFWPSVWFQDDHGGMTLRTLSAAKQAAQAWHGDKSEEIPDAWLTGRIQAIQASDPNIPYPDAMLQAVEDWFQQGEWSEEFKRQQGGPFGYRDTGIGYDAPVQIDPSAESHIGSKRVADMSDEESARVLRDAFERGGPEFNATRGYDESIMNYTGCSPQEVGFVEYLMRGERPTLDALDSQQFSELANESYELYKYIMKSGKNAKSAMRKKTALTWPEVVEQAKAQGYTHVKTYGGDVPLDEVTPYGKPSGHTAIEFALDGDTVVEIPTGGGRGLNTGVWTLLKQAEVEPDELRRVAQEFIDEHDKPGGADTPYKIDGSAVEEWLRQKYPDRQDLMEESLSISFLLQQSEEPGQGLL